MSLDGSRLSFDVFPASESTPSKALPLGAAGCTSATVNMNPAGIRAVHEKNWSTATGDELQAKADVVRQIFEAMPMIPAMKRVVAGLSNYPRWGAVRPSL